MADKEKTMADVDAEELPPFPSAEWERHMNSGVRPSALDHAIWGIMRKHDSFEPNDDEQQVAAVVVFKPGLDKDDVEDILARLQMVVDFATFSEYTKGSGVPTIELKKVE